MGTTVEGKVEQGMVKPGDKLWVMPNRVPVEVLNSPSQQSCGQSPASLVPAQAELSAPCSPQPREHPQPPQEQPGVPPSRPRVCGAVCQVRGWSDLHLQAGQAGP